MVREMKCVFCNFEKIMNQIFFETENYCCLYNIKPVLPGHSLIIPRKHVESFLDFKEDELKEMFLLVQKIVKVLMKTYGSNGFNLGIQEGESAGQSIQHFHIHLLPRRTGDMEGDPSKWFTRLFDNKNLPIFSEEDIKRNISMIKKQLSD